MMKASQSVTAFIQAGNIRVLRGRGLSLLELMVVLAIIAAMVAMAVPYATRSNASLKMRQECLSMAESVRYLIDLAAETNRTGRMVVEPQAGIYGLEMSTEASNHNFKPIDGFGGQVRYLGPNIRITDVSGFETKGNGYSLTFEPAKPWPDAAVSLSNGEDMITIRIGGKQVEIEDSTLSDQ